MKLYKAKNSVVVDNTQNSKQRMKIATTVYTVYSIYVHYIYTYSIYSNFYMDFD